MKSAQTKQSNVGIELKGIQYDQKNRFPPKQYCPLTRVFIMSLKFSEREIVTWLIEGAIAPLIQV